jgi:type I restriction enzyme S subunit
VQRTPYPRYRSSGVDWLGDVPDHWQIKRLKYSATMNDEALAETTHSDFELRYVDIGSVDAVDGIVVQEEMIFQSAPSRARRVVREGDTIVSTVRTYLRAIAPVRNPPDNLIVSTGFAVVRPGSVNPGYLSYALRESSFVETIVAKSVGVSYPAVNASEVATIPIPLPSHYEQQAIAHFLDAETARLDALVAKKRELIEKLKERRSALISRTVTRGLPPEAARAAGLNPNPKLKPSGIEWLGEIPEHWEMLQYRRITKRVDVGIAEAATHAYVDEGVPIVRSTNIKNRKVNTDDLLFIDQEFAARLTSKALRTGDIVTTRTGANLGVSAIIPPELHLAQCFTLLISTLRPGCAPRFYNAFMNADPGKTHFAMTAWGAGQPNISVPILQEMPCVQPPPIEQVEMADYLDRETNKIDRMVAKVEEAIECLQEYRSALITAAVTGKIDVRNVRHSGENRKVDSHFKCNR